MASEHTATRSTRDTQLKELFTEQLQELYWSERKLARSLLRMQKAALHPHLAEAFQRQHEQTRQHQSQLEAVFDLIGETIRKAKSPAMAGILAEAALVMEEREEKSDVTDVALIMVAQMAKHYEIASYGTLAELARTMDYQEVSNVLHEILQQKKQADTLLTLMAVSDINRHAMVG